MKAYLRIGNDTLEEATQFASKRAAVEHFIEVANELARYDQQIEASIHYADSELTLTEYPDFVLSLGPKGGIKVEKA